MANEDFAYIRPFNVVDGAFKPDEVDAIIAYCERLPIDEAAVYGTDGGTRDKEVRITQTAWVHPVPQINWLYQRMSQVVQHINAQVYQYDLQGFSEPFQYTVYRGPKGSYYDWHVDQGALKQQRKLSMSVQLSDGADYEGCDLQINGGGGVAEAPRHRGAVVVFPSYALHRVTPITAGVRKSLVVWNSGPKFR